MNSTEVNETGVLSESEMYRKYTFTEYREVTTEGVTYHCRILDLNSNITSKGVFTYSGNDYPYIIDGIVTGSIAIDNITMGIVQYEYNMSGDISVIGDKEEKKDGE